MFSPSLLLPYGHRWASPSGSSAHSAPAPCKCHRVVASLGMASFTLFLSRVFAVAAARALLYVSIRIAFSVGQKSPALSVVGITPNVYIPLGRRDNSITQRHSKILECLYFYLILLISLSET